MLDYAEVKKAFADKLAADANGHFESAFYHVIEYVYHRGVSDGRKDEQRFVGEPHHTGVVNNLSGEANPWRGHKP